MHSIPHLTLVPGGLAEVGRVAGRRVLVVEENDRAFEGATIVHEEDTHLVLSAPSIVHEIETHPIRVIDAVHHDVGRVPGTIIHRPGAILAVVHDLALDETTRPEWISSAAKRALAAADERGLRRLVFQPLGAVHGRITVTGALHLILDAINDRTFECLETIAVRVTSGQLESAQAALGHWLANRVTRG